MAPTETRIPIPLRTPPDRRESVRLPAAMPLRVDGRETTTQDISEGGIAFESERPYAPGERVSVVVEYMLDGAYYPLRCEAEVLRVERRGSGYAVGARLILEPGIDGRALRPDA